MKRPRQIVIRQRTVGELATLAQRAVYLGSSEHKNKRWWGGRPEGWVQTAINAGQCRFSQEDKNFPKWIWHEADGQIWMGYLVNDGLGQYKGWPIDEVERDEIFG